MINLFQPAAFSETNRETVDSFIDNFGFGILITPEDMGFSFLPAIRKPGGIIECHLSKSNPQLRRIDDQESLAYLIFLGPHSYISPKWYVANSVPTWNYGAVIAKGKLTKMSPLDLSDHLDDLVSQYEKVDENGWSSDQLEVGQLESEKSGIVGLRMRVLERVAKFKLGQNRSAEDITGMIEGLAASGSPSTSLFHLFISSYYDNNPDQLGN